LTLSSDLELISTYHLHKLHQRIDLNENNCLFKILAAPV